MRGRVQRHHKVLVRWRAIAEQPDHPKSNDDHTEDENDASNNDDDISHTQ